MLIVIHLSMIKTVKILDFINSWAIIYQHKITLY